MSHMIFLVEVSCRRYSCIVVYHT